MGEVGYVVGYVIQEMYEKYGVEISNSKVVCSGG